MKKAVKDYHAGEGPLVRDPKAKGTYSPTGTWGDPTLATREKGEKVVAALVAAVLREIEETKRAPLPEQK